MRFTKIKNFTESNEVRIKASTSKGVIINKLVIYIGGDVYDKYFGDSKSAFVRIMVNDKKEININLSKINIDQRYKEYKFCITGHGICKTRKLLVSIPDSVTNDLSKYVENRTVFYCTRNDGIIDSLMLNIDTIEKDIKGVFKRSVDNIEVSNKKPKNIKTVRKTKKNKLIVNGIDQATLDKPNKSNFDIEFTGVCGDTVLLGDQIKYGKLDHQTAKNIRKDNLTENNVDPITLDKRFREKFNLDKQERNKLIELYKLREDLDLNNQYRYEELKKLIYGMKEYFDVNNKIQEDILNNLKNIHNNTLARLDFIDSIYEKRIREEQLIISLMEHKHKTEKRLIELENKFKTNKEDKRSVFGRIFGE